MLVKIDWFRFHIDERLRYRIDTLMYSRVRELCRSRLPFVALTSTLTWGTTTWTEGQTVEKMELQQSTTDDIQQSKMDYLGVFLDAESREKLSTAIGFKFAQSQGAHVTLSYNPSEEEIQAAPCGSAITILLHGVVTDEHIQTGIVSLVPDNRTCRYILSFFTYSYIHFCKFTFLQVIHIFMYSYIY